MATNYDVVIEDVSFAYSNEPVLENAYLSVEHGDFATVVGPNGGGKTTLLKLLLGLLKPGSGTIEILGDIPGKTRLRIGYMPQHIDLDLQFPVTVMDVVLMGRLGRSLGGRYSKDDRKAAENSLEEVQLEGLRKRPFNELSGGQRQRVLIARALCGNPEMLLLDEPTTNIDVEAEEALINILQELNQRMTILMVSHNLEFVSSAVKNVICVNRRVAIHPTKEIDDAGMRSLYSGDFRMICHDQTCFEGDHTHD